MALVERSSKLHLYSIEDTLDDNYKVSISNTQAKVSWGGAAAGAQKIQMDFEEYEFRKADDSYFSLEGRFNDLETDTTGADNATDIGQLQADLAAETVSRTSADASNSAATSAEVVARTSAVSAVQADVDQNEADADSAIAVVQVNVDAEAAARVTAVADEAAARVAAVAAIQAQITNILSNADPASLDSLSEIVAAFEGADSTLTGALSALTTRMAAAEAVLNEAFDSGLS